MSNDQDIAVGPEDEASGITEEQRAKDPQGTAAAEQDTSNAIPNTGGTQFHHNQHQPDIGDDAEVEPFNDEPVRASKNPELAPTSQNPNEPVGDHPAISLTSLLVDMYAVSGQKAYEMCRFGTITIGDEEWTDKTSFAIPYEQIKGKEVTILEEGRGGFKFRYDG